MSSLYDGGCLSYTAKRERDATDRLYWVGAWPAQHRERLKSADALSHVGENNRSE